MSEATQNTETQTAAEAAHNQLAVLSPERRAELALNSKDTALQLQQLVAESADITEVTDKDSRAMAHNAAMKLKNTRIAIEKVGKAAREDAQAFSKAVIAEEKRLKEIITPEEDRVFKLRDEYDQKVEAERQERERKERERVAAIREQIDAIKALPMESANDQSVQLHATIHELMELPVGDDFAEFKEEAEAAKWDAVSALQQLWNAATEREAAAARLAEEEARLKAEREQLEAQRLAEEARQQAERDRLAAERAAEEERLQAERDKLAAERAEFEAWKAQQAAQQAAQQQPEPVAEVQAEPVQEEVQPEPVLEEVPAPQPELFAESKPADEPAATQPDDSQADVTDAKAFTRELSKVLAMQFNALADKVAAFGQDGFAAALRDDAAAFDTGMYDLNIFSADWTAMADADKALALASHAGVALVYGDDAMGGSVLLQAAE